MKWWKKALLFSGLWIALTLGAGIVHTDVILAGKITQEQDEAISEKYGQVLGAGLIVIWAVAFSRRKKS